MMPTYYVSVDFTGHIERELEAESENEAIELAVAGVDVSNIDGWYGAYVHEVKDGDDG